MTEINHIVRMSEQIGELNGTVKSMSEHMIRFIESNEKLHTESAKCCTDTKIGIEKINARHATYWKIIGSLGGLGAILTGWSKGIGN